MSKNLINSGLPIDMDDKYLLSFKNSLLCKSYGRKETCEMNGLLMDSNNINEHDIVYDVYRNILFENDEKIFKKDNYRYDITLIMPGTINGEAKKTSGHYHGFNPKGISTYPEVYEVIKGSAIFILQKALNFKNFKNLEVEDIILVRVEEGEKIIIPPNYGHCSINVSDIPLVFSNLAYVDCPIHYDAVKYFNGMGVYVKKRGNEIEFATNKKYPKLPTIRYAKVKENSDMGIQFGKPIYTNYIKHSELFNFLGNADKYINEIMSMLKFVKVEDIKR